MAKTIGIIQVKGGAGRSTIATNLAACLSRKAPTVLIDCDLPQGTSMSWYAVRAAERLPDNLALVTAEGYRELIEQVNGLNQVKDFIVLDAPPRIAEITRAILMIADLIIVPVGASAAEIWATSDLLDTIEEAKQKRPQLNYKILWNRFRSYTKSAREISQSVHAELKPPEFKTRLGFRVAYGDALANGLAVDEWHDPTAKDEMRNLTREVIQALEN
jgi:chromosome partitioning protein